MKTKKYALPILILICTLTFANILSCSTTLESATESKKGKSKDEIPGPTIAFIPFEYSSELSAKKSKEVIQILAQTMLETKTFHPTSLKLWMNKIFYRKKAPNIQKITSFARSAEIPVDFICHGNIFKSGKLYGLSVSMYPIDSKLKPSYYLRYFSSLRALDDSCEEIVKEMVHRGIEPPKPLFNKSIFIKKFDINFYTYTVLKSGEGALVPLPYLDVNNVSYKKTDHFFNEVLLYSLHSTRLVTAWNSNMKKYIRLRPSIPQNIDYVVSVKIDISEKGSRLTIKVKDNNKNSTVSSYKYAFKNLDLNKLHEVMIENSKNIILSVLNTKERKKVGVVNLNHIHQEHHIFCENYYLGNGSKKNLIFPTGGTNYLISNQMYKMYITPFGINEKIFKLEDLPIFRD